MSGHTLGEWKLERTGVIPIVVTADGDSICQVYGHRPQAYVDGQLIAASPDLLVVCKALEKAEASYRLIHDVHGGDSPESGRAWDKLRRCGDKARAAIKLAEDSKQERQD